MLFLYTKSRQVVPFIVKNSVYSQLNGFDFTQKIIKAIKESRR